MCEDSLALDQKAVRLFDKCNDNVTEISAAFLFVAFSLAVSFFIPSKKATDLSLNLKYAMGFFPNYAFST